MQWTKEDQDNLRKFGLIIGEAKFNITGEQVVSLYEGLRVLGKINKFVGEELARPAVPAPTAAPPIPAEKPKRTGRKRGSKNKPKSPAEVHPDGDQ